HIYILQNDKSASASEVLIGALKENMSDTVTTIGTTTFGKGTEQITLPFEDGTALKYTIAEWTTPNGTSVNGVGLKPDIEVSADEVYSVSYIMPDEDDLEGWIIRPDTVHPNAYAVQVYLRALGYPADRSDTYFSAASSEAFKQFQQDQGLEATGFVDKDSFLALTTQVSNKLKTLLVQDDPDIHQALTLINPTRYGQDATDSVESSSTQNTESTESLESETLIQPESSLVETPLNPFPQEESPILPMEEGGSIPLYS
ncbi:MAG: peptidoglycan-binding protein, partial [Allobaculum sp.]|nr:peptidoglycan-binding protein [Allobaculum sp.]